MKLLLKILLVLLLTVLFAGCGNYVLVKQYVYVDYTIKPNAKDFTVQTRVWIRDSRGEPVELVYYENVSCTKAQLDSVKAAERIKGNVVKEILKEKYEL